MAVKRVCLVLLLTLALSGCGTQAISPAPDPIPANTYAAEAFTVVDGFLAYEGDCPSVTGVDVSAHQREIDWTAVGAAGVGFAMIRAGYRGYTEGGLHEDQFFRQNIEGALAQGLDVGVYFFSQAVSEAEAVEEAEYLLDLIQGYEVTYPLVFDWERQDHEGSRTLTTSGEVITDCAVAFCETVEAAGYLPMTYFSPSKGYGELDLERLARWPFWLAHYTAGWEPTSFQYSFAIWQYSNEGTVDGIDAAVDLNLCLTDFSQ